jgi:hypothetical protein
LLRKGQRRKTGRQEQNHERTDLHS